MKLQFLTSSIGITEVATVSADGDSVNDPMSWCSSDRALHGIKLCLRDFLAAIGFTFLQKLKMIRSFLLKRQAEIRQFEKISL